jgi:hypothetical protein
MTAMRLSADIGQAGWIAPRLAGNDPRTSPLVGDLVPGGYDRYVRLFHPVYAGGEQLTWRRIASSAGTRFHPRVSFSQLLGDREEELISQVFPGAIQQRQLSRLVRALRRWTTAGPCWFGYAEATGADLADFLPLVTEEASWSSAEQEAATFRVWDEDFLLLTGPLDAVVPRPRPDLGLEPGYPILSPQLWWPADRGWFIVTMLDLEFTLIGAPAGLAADLLADTELETAEVDWDDDLSVG